ncbi:MAG: ABC transporter substrate-binding protein [Oligoflexales bacterium]
MYRRAKQVLITLVILCILPSHYASGISLVLGERLVPNNPWRNQVIKMQYEIAIAHALKSHKRTFPNSKINLLTSFDTGPAQGFKIAEKEKALAVVGYLYSMEANEAAQLAEKYRIPYITPVSPLQSIRNDYAFSMMNSFDILSEKMKLLAKQKDFVNPSILITPKTYLANYEYDRIFREAFNVVETISEQKDVSKKIENKIKNLNGYDKINILLSGFAFEQVDLVKSLTQGKIADKINILVHSQWTYCLDILSATINDDAKNFYFISDHFESLGNSVKLRLELSQILDKESALTGEDLNQPIVYVLRDMIAYILMLAESSKDRNEFLRKARSGKTVGVSGVYSFTDGKPEREVFLGKWVKGKIIPIRRL